MSPPSEIVVSGFLSKYWRDDFTPDLKSGGFSLPIWIRLMSLASASPPWMADRKVRTGADDLNYQRPFNRV
ncbi:MAG TPA: hypothetical protein VFU37_07545 [Pyrinomonadaceae bacterium]|nr:hypothetical protein [Pyrinomonadaceae bacterium]